MRYKNVALLLPVLTAVSAFAQGYLSPLESNKKLVFDLYRLVIEPRNTDLVEQFVSNDFIEHDARFPGGKDSFVKLIKSMGPAVSEDIGSDLHNPPASIAAAGDLVVYIFPDKAKTSQGFTFDAYRIKERKIAEHWTGATK
jgi:predicted SnoaL-like aldol condensation-catalyzing enzyme